MLRTTHLHLSKFLSLIRSLNTRRYPTTWFEGSVRVHAIRLYTLFDISLCTTVFFCPYLYINVHVVFGYFLILSTSMHFCVSFMYMFSTVHVQLNNRWQQLDIPTFIFYLQRTSFSFLETESLFYFHLISLYILFSCETAMPALLAIHRNIRNQRNLIK